MENAADHKSGRPLASLEWLIAHHEAKRAHRLNIVSKWPIEGGDSVLDIAAGPGFWTPMIREKNGPEGVVVNTDIAWDLLKESSIRNPNTDWSSQCFNVSSTMEELPFKENSFDVVHAGNCYAYTNNPIKLVRQHSQYVKKRGYYIVRLWDNSATVYSHVDESILFKVLSAAAESNTNTLGFNNYMGRNLYSICKSAGLNDFSFTTNAVPIMGKLNHQEESYLRYKALWFANQAKNKISGSLLKKWMSYFEPSSDNYILKLDDFYFCTLEMQVIWRST